MKLDIKSGPCFCKGYRKIKKTDCPEGWLLPQRSHSQLQGSLGQIVKHLQLIVQMKVANPLNKIQDPLQ